MSNPSKYKHVLKSVDVSTHVVKSGFRKSSRPITNASVHIRSKVSDVLIIDDSIIGEELVISRGVSLPDERVVFRGEVVSFRKNGSLFELNCVCRMNRARRLEYDYIYDFAIDSEAGVGSEIFKSLLDVAGLSYDDNSVPSTGDINTVKVFRAEGSIINSLNSLAKLFNRHFFYRSSSDKVFFIEDKTEVTSTVLSVGSNVVGRIMWNDTGEDIINSLTVSGGRQLDWATESFTGTIDEVSLLAPPIDTEIKSDGSLLSRGVNSVDPKDFYVSEKDKKIVFSDTHSDVVVRYSYSVPIKVKNVDSVSVGKYFLVEGRTSDTKLSTSDDAELFGEGLIEKHSKTLINAPIRVSGNNDLEVGHDVRVVDSISGVDTRLEVTGIEINFPYRPDSLGVGLLASDSFDRDNTVAEKLLELERQLSTDTDILVSLLNNPFDLDFEVLVKLEKAVADTGVLYWDSDVQGDWDLFDWGDDSEESYAEVFKEVGFDD